MSLTGAWKRPIRVPSEHRSHMPMIRERPPLAGGRSQNHAAPLATQIGPERMNGAAVTPGESPPSCATRVTAGCPVSMPPRSSRCLALSGRNRTRSCATRAQRRCSEVRLIQWANTRRHDTHSALYGERHRELKTAGIIGGVSHIRRPVPAFHAEELARFHDSCLDCVAIRKCGVEFPGKLECRAIQDGSARGDRKRNPLLDQDACHAAGNI